MNLSRRDKRAVVIGGLVLVVLLGYRYVAAPLTASWQNARQRIAETSAVRAAWRARANRLAAQQRRLEPIYGKAIGEPLPMVAKARANFVKTVQDILQSSGMSSQSVQSQPLRPLREVPGVALVALQVRTSGKPRQLMKALAAMRKADQLILVQSLSAEPGGERSKKMSISMVLATLANMEETA